MALEIYLIILAVGIAILDWLALRFQWKRIDYAAKPGVIILLLVAVYLVGMGTADFKFYRLILIGLVFSLFGDILLMLPRERFIGGLIAFVAAYLAYTAAFTPTLPPAGLGTIMVAIVFAGLTIYLLRAVMKGLETSGRNKMKPPTIVFGIMIYLMVTTALMTNLRPAWPAYSAIALGIGGVLVFLSDALLAWNRFVTPFSFARLKIRIPYHLGQIAIGIGALLLLKQ